MNFDVSWDSYVEDGGGVEVDASVVIAEAVDVVMELVTAVVVDPVCVIVVVKVAPVLVVGDVVVNVVDVNVVVVDVVLAVEVVLEVVMVTSVGTEIESNRVKRLFHEILKVNRFTQLFLCIVSLNINLPSPKDTTTAIPDCLCSSVLFDFGH